MNWAGDSHDPHSVVIDSALGLLGAAPHNKQDFLGQVQWLLDYLGAQQAPKFPFPVDEKKAAQINAGHSYIADVPSETIKSSVDGGRLSATTEPPKWQC